MVVIDSKDIETILDRFSTFPDVELSFLDNGYMDVTATDNFVLYTASVPVEMGKHDVNNKYFVPLSVLKDLGKVELKSFSSSTSPIPNWESILDGGTQTESRIDAFPFRELLSTLKGQSKQKQDIVHLELVRPNLAGEIVDSKVKAELKGIASFPHRADYVLSDLYKLVGFSKGVKSLLLEFDIYHNGCSIFSYWIGEIEFKFCLYPLYPKSV